jgi:molecular chaperone DnaK
MTEVELATRDTPDALKKALAEDERKRLAAQPPGTGPARPGGLFRWLKRG